MSLEEKFNAACNQIRKFTKKPGDTDMLEVYALYKQATVGNCNTAKPADVTGKAKWDAWNAKKGLKSENAKEQYVGKVKALAPTHA